MKPVAPGIASRLGLAALSALLSVPSFAQSKKSAQPAPGAEQPDPSAAVREWVRKLGDRSYKVRRQAEQALQKIGASAKDALRKAASRHEDPEIRWRADRLLREIEAATTESAESRSDNRATDQAAERSGRLRKRVPGEAGEESPAPTRRLGDRPADIDKLFESVFGQLERDFGVDIPRRRFFQDDFFRDLEAQMRDMGQLRLMPGRGLGQAFSQQIEIGENGVKVSITEKDEDGKPVTKTYEAPDFDTLRKEHPEIAKRIPGGGTGGVRLFFNDRPPFTVGPGAGGLWRTRPLPDPFQRPGRQDPLDRSRGEPFAKQDLPPADGPRLGVMVQPLDPALQEFLGVQHGLRVQEVVEDSLAAALGVEAGDALLSIDGRKITSPRDVASALQAAGERVTVGVNRRGKAMDLIGAMPRANGGDDPERPQAQPNSADGKLRKKRGTKR